MGTTRWTLVVLAIAAAGCGGPTWMGITREVAAGDAALDAGDAAGAAARYRAAGASLDRWLASVEGRGLKPDLDAGRVRIGRWTLAAFRDRALPRAALWARAGEDPAADAFVAARGQPPGGARIAAYLRVGLDLAAAGRGPEARVALDAADEVARETLPLPVDPVRALARLELACRLEDDALVRLTLATALSPPARPRELDLLPKAARILASHGRCEEARRQVGRMVDALEERWEGPGSSLPDDEDINLPPWSNEVLSLHLELSETCRRFGDVDGARSFLDEAVPWAELEGDEGLQDLGAAYLLVGLPGEAAALSGSLDDPMARAWLLVASVDAWIAGEGEPGASAPVEADARSWLEDGEAAALSPGDSAAAIELMEAIAERWQTLGDSERAGEARARAAGLRMRSGLGVVPKN